MPREKAMRTQAAVLRSGKYDDEKYVVQVYKKYVMATEDWQITEDVSIAHGDTFGYIEQDDENYRVIIDGVGVFWVEKSHFKYFSIPTGPRDHVWKVTEMGAEPGVTFDWIECEVCNVKCKRRKIDHRPILKSHIKYKCAGPKNQIILPPSMAKPKPTNRSKSE